MKTNMVVVVPGSSSQPFSAGPSFVEVLGNSSNGLESGKTYFQCHQIRAVDKARLMGRAKGRLLDKDLERIDAGVKVSVGIRA